MVTGPRRASADNCAHCSGRHKAAGHSPGLHVLPPMKDGDSDVSLSQGLDDLGEPVLPSPSQRQGN